jgi:hypothetical protein
MKQQVLEKFKSWYQKINGPMALISPAKSAYIQGSKDGALILASKIAECLTFEEVMDLLRKECDSIEQMGE